MAFRVPSAISDIYPIAREVDFIELFQLNQLGLLVKLVRIISYNDAVVQKADSNLLMIMLTNASSQEYQLLLTLD